MKFIATTVLHRNGFRIITVRELGVIETRVFECDEKGTSKTFSPFLVLKCKGRRNPLRHHTQVCNDLTGKKK